MDLDRLAAVAIILFFVGFCTYHFIIPSIVCCIYSAPIEISLWERIVTSYRFVALLYLCEGALWGYIYSILCKTAILFGNDHLMHYVYITIIVYVPILTLIFLEYQIQYI